MINQSAIDPGNYSYDGWTATDLVDRFGSIPILRVCMNPAPGTATEEDVVRLHDRTNRLYELVDGTLVEKVMGTYESYIAGVIVRILGNFVTEHKLGIVLGADGMLRFAPGLIRIPDVSFISKDRLSGADLSAKAVASIIPNIAVEVISTGNTREEMDRKLAEYFQTGVQLVWYVYPRDRTIMVFSCSDKSITLRETETLDGGSVLPGFTMLIADLFAEPF